jgi:drug/metabolite transporter (DMT)-like permease
LLGALSYGVTNVYARRSFADLNPVQASVGQICGSAVLMLPLAMIAPPRAALTWPALLALLALTVLCTVLASFIYFRLIVSAGPTRTSTVALLIPLFGILWAAVFLHEPMNLGVLAGLGVILLSIWLVIGNTRRRPRGGKHSR